MRHITFSLLIQTNQSVLIYRTYLNIKLMVLNIIKRLFTELKRCSGNEEIRKHCHDAVIEQMNFAITNLSQSFSTQIKEIVLEVRLFSIFSRLSEQQIFTVLFPDVFIDIVYLDYLVVLFMFQQMVFWQELSHLQNLHWNFSFVFYRPFSSCARLIVYSACYHPTLSSILQMNILSNVFSSAKV